MNWQQLAGAAGLGASFGALVVWALLSRGRAEAAELRARVVAHNLELAVTVRDVAGAIAKVEGVPANVADAAKVLQAAGSAIFSSLTRWVR